VQDLMRREEMPVAGLLRSSPTHIYVCGLKGMEQGVDAALDDICRASKLRWHELRDAMRAEGRYHVETY
jgi:benzoyl-CoA 2,3-epoxidase subunit A